MTAAALRHDVVVVGAGIAGLVAANRAAQLGLRVVVLEQGEAERYLCNTRYTGGTFHIAYTDVAKPSDELLAIIDSTTAGFARKDLAAAIAADGIRLVRWLQAEGIKFLNLGKHHTFVLAPPSRTGPGLDWEGRGGDVLLRTLEAALAKRGGTIVRGTRALAIDRAAGMRVEAEQRGGPVRFEADAVVLADGGFQSDLELIRSHITPVPEKLQQRNARTSRGDALRMARSIGAVIVGMDCFYGHLLSRDAMTNAKLWPRPYVDALAVAGIVVDGSGTRFADEGEGGVFLANAVARLPDPLGTTLVFDHDVWTGPGTSPLIPANPHLPNAGGTLHSARSIAELAGKMGVPTEALGRTVDEYNAAVDVGTTGALSPSRRRDKHTPFPIRKPPFYAVPLCVGITNMMGGIAVDEHGAVLDEQGTPIRGVFAAGATTGGLEGGPEIGYVGGLIKAVLGLRASERIFALRQAQEEMPIVIAKT
jgi:fumarate reductase flavoprotein subunit